MAHVTIDADAMRRELQRDQPDCRAGIWTYTSEIGIPLLLVPVWFYLGARMSSSWTWYLPVPVLIWGAGFMLVHRLRHKQKPSEPGKPLLDRAERSLTEVEDQIWLMRNTFWWYMLPLGISFAAFLADATWLESKSIGRSCVLVVFVFAVWYFIYWVGQRTVRSRLEPRRQKLLTLLTSLKEETTRQT